MMLFGGKAHINNALLPPLDLGHSIGTVNIQFNMFSAPILIEMSLF